MMKNLWFILLLFSFQVIYPQKKNDSEASFRKLCSEIANAFAKQSIKDINKYINPEIGIYIITRPGVMDNASHQKSLDEVKPFIIPYPYKDKSQIKKHKVVFGTSPRYDCGTEKWDKRGFIADSSTLYDRASAVYYMTGKYGGEKLAEEEMEKIKTLEKRSRKVVFTELKKGKGIVFHVTLMNGKWYLFLVDLVAGSCEA